MINKVNIIKQSIVLTSILLIAASTPVVAANYYIRDGATGTSCSDWTTANACDKLPATLQRGSTYFVADGNYDTYIFNPTGTGTATVLKALDNPTCTALGKTASQCHGSDVGWSDAYGVGAASFTGWEIRGGDLVIDGQKGAGFFDLNNINYGFKVKKNTGYVVCIGAGCTGSQTTLNNLTIYHTEIEGGGDDGANCTVHNKGIFMYYGSYDNIKLAYNYIHDVGNMNLDLQNMSNGLIEYNYIARNESLNTSGCEEHSEGLFGSGSGNSTVRFNAWEDIEGTGVIMMGGSNWKVYGNVIFRTGNPTYSSTGNGSIAGWSGSPFSNSFIYNNTVANCMGGCSINPTGLAGGGTGNNNVILNNIVTDTATYNPAIFVNPSQKNFHLAAAFPGGTTLSSPYDKDADNKTRGADGVWDMGAFEFINCTQTLSTGANLVSAVTSATPGAVICLNAGNYGNVNLANITKTNYVTLRSVSGVGAQMSPTISNSKYIRLEKLTLSDAVIEKCSTNIQLVGNTWVEDTGGIHVDDYDDNCSATVNKNILIDGNTFVKTRRIGDEGKITITESNGVTITNNTIQGQPGAELPSGSKTGGDGIQIRGASNNVIIGPGNIFREILQEPCGPNPSIDPHCDSIQIVGSVANANIVINGNWFDNVEVTLQHHDFDNAPVKFTNNLITNSRHVWSYGPPSAGTLIEHNTFYVQGDANWGRYGGVNSSGLNFRSNILLSSATPYYCTAATCSASYNLGDTSSQAIGTNSLVGTPTFVGGNPATITTWAGWQLASGSIGKNNAHDGLDRGTNYFGTGTAPTPPGNASPTVSVTSSPTTATAPATITLNATASDSDGTVASVAFYNGSTLLSTDTSSPYSYTWSSVAAGSYSVRAVATDDKGATSTATITVVVDGPALPAGSLVAYWALNETSGTTASDSSGNGKTASLSGSPVWAAGIAGNGLTLNGTNAYVNAGSFNLTQFTLSVWMNMTAVQSGWMSIIMKQHVLGMEIQNGVLSANVGNGSSWSSSISAPLSAGAWHHVVQTYDGSNNRLYVDGNLIASGTGALTNNSNNLLIGSWNGSSEFFNGKVDEVKIYNGALTATQVKGMYDAIVSPVILGDVNVDGNVNITDVLLTSQYAVGSATPTATQRTAADMNSDGVVNISDVLLVARKAVGL